MNEDQINRLYQDVVRQRNMEKFRPLLTPSKEMHKLVFLEGMRDLREALGNQEDWPK